MELYSHVLLVTGILFLIWIGGPWLAYLLTNARGVWLFISRWLMALWETMWLTSRVPSPKQLTEDLRVLLDTTELQARSEADPNDHLARHELAERASTWNLLNAHAVIAAQANVLRGARPDTGHFRRILVRIPGLGRLGRDLQLTMRRTGLRPPREAFSLVLVGRQFGMGKVPASEVPAQRYTFGADRVHLSWPAELIAASIKGPPRFTVERLDRVARLTLATFAQSLWIAATGRDGHREVGMLRLAELEEEVEQRECLLSFLKPPKASEIVSDFDSFLRPRADALTGVHDPLDLVASAVETDRSTGCGVISPFDVSAIGIVVAAATEFSRRPATSDPERFLDSQAQLWVAYYRWYAALKSFLQGEANAETFSVESGRFLRICFRACGRRETRDLHWAQRRERDRWRIAKDPSRRQQARALADATRGLHTRPAAGDLPSEQGLFSICVDRCVQTGCRANWDIGLLLSRSDLGPVCRFAALACAHTNPTSFERVVGIARSGLTCASVLSFATGKPMSLAFIDNVLDLVPQPAVSERWLLVDDAYQTGYTFELLRSQVFGLQASPSPTRLFVALKAKNRNCSVHTESFRLSERMDKARRSVGYAALYEYAGDSRFPILIEDKTLGVPEDVVTRLQGLLLQSLQNAREYDWETLRKSASASVTQYGFREVGLLFDSPQMVLSLGHEIYQRSVAKTGDVVGYVCGSGKAIPFVAAACLHATAYGRPAPLVLRCVGDRFRYDEILMDEANRRHASRLVYVDTSTRTGGAYAAVQRAVRVLNSRRGALRRFELDPGYVCVTGWPTRRRDIPHCVLLD